MACISPLENTVDSFNYIGGALFLGVAACFLTSVIVLPGILGIIERKKGSHLNI